MLHDIRYNKSYYYINIFNIKRIQFSGCTCTNAPKHMRLAERLELTFKLAPSLIQVRSDNTALKITCL